jgi:hypothetical protein
LQRFLAPACHVLLMAISELDTRTTQVLDPHPWLPYMVHRFCILQLRALLAGERRWAFENVYDFPVERGTESLTRQFIMEFGAATKTRVGRLKDDTKVFCIFWDSSKAAADVRVATLALLRKWTSELSLRSVRSKSLSREEVHRILATSPSSEEREMIFDFIAGDVDQSSVLGKLRINLPYVAALEWLAIEGRDDLGRGDLVMTNGYGIFVVIECKYIDHQATGKSARQKRTRQRKMVKQQALDYRDHYQRLNPDAVVLACSFTNEGLLFMDKDGGTFCQDSVAGFSSTVERRLTPEYVLQLDSEAAAEEAVAEQKMISNMQILEKQILEYRQRLSEAQERLDRLRGQIVHEKLENERLREIARQKKEVGCNLPTVFVIGTTLGIWYLMRL